MTLAPTPLTPQHTVSGVHATAKSWKQRFGFMLQYAGVTTVLFGLLMLATNFSAYSQVFMTVVSPERLSQAQSSLFEALHSSQIQTVAAAQSDQHSLSDEIITKKAEELKENLESRGVELDPLRAMDPNRYDLAPSPVAVTFDITPYENRIIIPKIGKNIPLVDVHISQDVDFDHMENIFMQELENGIVRYPGTAMPGEQGNSFIFGHSSNYPWMKGNYNDVFALLDELVAGDEIIVYYGQKKFVYKVTDKKVVRPGDVKALSERDPNKKELTLMTCWPIGTTYNRLLVFTELQ